MLDLVPIDVPLMSASRLASSRLRSYSSLSSLIGASFRHVLPVVEQLTHPRLQPDTLTLEHTKCRATASPLPQRARPKYGSVA
jgi:hypothetical protein